MTLRACVGLAIWIAALGLLISSLARGGGGPGQTAEQVWRFFSQPRRVVELRFDRRMEVRVGDPIFWDQQGKSIRVGEIWRVTSLDSRQLGTEVTDRAYALFYSSAPALAEGDYCTIHHTPSSLAWTVRMMLPAETRDQIQLLLAEAVARYEPHVVELLAPIVEQSLREAWSVAEVELQRAIERRQQEFEQLLNKYEFEILRARLFPLLAEEVWPIVQRRAAPLMDRIGEQIWARVSLWRFGSSLVRDVIPFTGGSATRREFDRFVQAEAVPVLEEHVEEMIRILQLIVEDALRNQRVRQELTESLQHVLEDPELHALLGQVIREVFLDNPRFHEALAEPWRSEQAAQAMDQINQWMEPSLNQIGILLFGTPDEAITPEFSRVLRERVLLKDSRWLVLHRVGEGPLGVRVLPVTPGPTDWENPFHVSARATRK